MAVRSTMQALIARVRLLIDDTDNACQHFFDEQIQEVLDASRLDMRNVALKYSPTYTGSSISFLDFYAEVGDWEDDATFQKWLSITVTPATSEPIAGHWHFTSDTQPPVYITGKTYDVYRAAADLLERWAASYARKFNVIAEGQRLERSQVAPALQALAKQYRMQQRPTSVTMTRSDMATGPQEPNLGPTWLDYRG